MSKCVPIDMIRRMMVSTRDTQYPATGLSLLVALILTLGLPLHLSHDHHHDYLTDSQSAATIDHEHHRHDIVDHDWDGLRAQFQYQHCLPAATGYDLLSPQPQSFIAYAADNSIVSGSGVGPPQYRAPPFA